MSFYDDILGSETEKVTGAFDTNINFEPIPDNTNLHAYIEAAEWKKGNPEYGTQDRISLSWRVLGPEEYKNRMVFQNIHIMDTDKDKKKRAARMLLAIDANAGGGLKKDGGAPTNEILQANLCQKQMIIKVMVWKMGEGGQKRYGNWVAAVSPKVAGQVLETPKVEEPFSDDEIPF